MWKLKSYWLFQKYFYCCKNIVKNKTCFDNLLNRTCIDFKNTNRPKYFNDSETIKTRN